MNDVDISAISNSVMNAAAIVHDGLTPFWLDCVMTGATALMAIATVALVIYNGRTVNAALLQISESEKARKQSSDLSLYPLRRELLKTIDDGEFETIRVIATDVELLLPESYDIYCEYVRLKHECEELRWKLEKLESGVDALIAGRESDLLLAKRILGELSDEEILSGKAHGYSGIQNYFDNPKTGETELLDWDELSRDLSMFSVLSSEAYSSLRECVKKEINRSLKG